MKKDSVRASFSIIIGLMGQHKGSNYNYSMAALSSVFTIVA